MFKKSLKNQRIERRLSPRNRLKAMEGIAIHYQEKSDKL